MSLARDILLRRPGLTVIVLDKEQHLAAHASGRNSGVLHAGFYYAPDSLKAQLTRRGNVLLHEFCAEHGVAVRTCGKVVVTTAPDQLPALDTLAARGEANGVPLEIIDEAGLNELEPLARTVDRALWSPTTSVSSPVAVVEALAEDVRRRGGRVVLGAQALGHSGDQVLTSFGPISTGHVINAAGLYADTVARWFGMCDDYAMLPFKGLYWYGNWALGRLQRHVYPVPDPRNPFLGVHLTVTVDGRAKIGPTAIPALWREDDGGVHGMKAAEVADVVRRYPAFLRSPHHDVPGLIRTEVPKYSRRHLVNQARALVPSVSEKDFREKGRPGVRAQLLHLPTRKLEMDFIVRGDQRSTHELNAVSPAWTSALAVAEHVVAGMQQRGVL